MSEPIIVFWTCAGIDEARHVARTLVKAKLVACANIIPQVESIFEWEGNFDVSQESKVLFKTTLERFEAVKARILELCSYDVPEISYVIVDGGHQPYFEWVRTGG